MQLKLGQAFSLASLIEFGPLLPIESTGHLKERVALFRSTGKPRAFSALHFWLGGPRLLPLSSRVDDDLVTSSGSDVPGAGISEADINKFLGYMAEERRGPRAYKSRRRPQKR